MKLSTIAALIAGTCVAAAFLESTTTQPTTRAQISKAPASLRLLTSRCYAEHGFRQIIGEVKNTTSQPIASALAVVRFTTAGGDLVKFESALLEYNPIMPGQTSPFHVISTDNPAIAKCDIAFRSMFGGEISFIR